jgi:WD40 repeat protein
MRLRAMLGIVAVGIGVVTEASSMAAKESYPPEIVQQIGHSTLVMSVAISPDGRLALSVGADGTLKLWDTATAKLLRNLGEGFNAVAFSSDSRFALSPSRDRTLRLRVVATGKEIRSLGGHSGGTESIVFSPNDRFVLTGGCDEKDPKTQTGCLKGSMKLWEAATGKLTRIFSGHAFGSLLMQWAVRPFR